MNRKKDKEPNITICMKFQRLEAGALQRAMEEIEKSGISCTKIYLEINLE